MRRLVLVVSALVCVTTCVDRSLFQHSRPTSFDRARPRAATDSVVRASATTVPALRVTRMVSGLNQAVGRQVHHVLGGCSSPNARCGVCSRGVSGSCVGWTSRPPLVWAPGRDRADVPWRSTRDYHSDAAILHLPGQPRLPGAVTTSGVIGAALELRRPAAATPTPDPAHQILSTTGAARRLPSARSKQHRPSCWSAPGMPLPGPTRRTCTSLGGKTLQLDPDHREPLVDQPLHLLPATPTPATCSPTGTATSRDSSQRSGRNPLVGRARNRPRRRGQPASRWAATTTGGTRCPGYDESTPV